MSVTKNMVLSLIALGALGASQFAQANCNKEPMQPTSILNMDLGRVVISPDLNVNDTIIKRTFKTRKIDGRLYECDTSTKLTFLSQLVNPGKDMGNDIYATNIEGVGMRLSLGGKENGIRYPGRFVVEGKNFIDNDSIITIELIKIAPITGSGTLRPGLYARYIRDKSTIAITESYITLNGVTIVSPSCKVSGGNDIRVDMPTEDLSSFKGVGTKVGRSTIPLKMMCSGGTSFSGYANINTSFSGNSPSGYDSTKGVLVNEYSGDSAAKGIGFIIEHDDTPVTFDKPYFVGKLTDGGQSEFTVPLTTSYYQYSSDITAGHVLGNAVYNITYD